MRFSGLQSWVSKVGSAWDESGALGLTSSSVVDPSEAEQANFFRWRPPPRPPQKAELESGAKEEAYSPPL